MGAGAGAAPTYSKEAVGCGTSKKFKRLSWVSQPPARDARHLPLRARPAPSPEWRPIRGSRGPDLPPRAPAPRSSGPTAPPAGSPAPASTARPLVRPQGPPAFVRGAPGRGADSGGAGAEGPGAAAETGTEEAAAGWRGRRRPGGGGGGGGGSGAEKAEEEESGGCGESSGGPAASSRAPRAQARLACESRPPPRRGRPETPAPPSDENRRQTAL